MSSKVNLLIIEDSAIETLNIEMLLSSMDGMRFIGAEIDLEAIIQQLETHSIELIICDIDLGLEYNGIDIIQRLRELKYRFEVFFLTGLHEDLLFEQMLSLEPIGYQSKPFQHDELKVNLEIARTKITKQRPQISFASGFQYRFDDRTLYRDNRYVELKEKEKSALEILLLNLGKMVPYHTFEYSVWDQSISPGSRRTFINRLNNKLDPNRRIIQSLTKEGYKIDPS
jgi:DNA-binding response OmpR family regulator